MSFELGCNWWPRRSAMYLWRELDLGAVREEMAHLRDLGFSVVRFFALTEDFLPGPMQVEPRRIAELVAVARAAADAGLRSVPTLIVINMSGRAWWPSWLRETSGAEKSLFADPTVLRSQALLAQECARALAGDRSIRAFDLSNEIDDAQRPPSRDAGWLWCELLAGTIRRAAPGVPIQIGTHLASLDRANNMRVDDLARVADEDCMHAYPLYSPVARHHLDPELVPFSCALTADLAGTGRPPLMQEFGLCTAPPGRPGETIVDDFLGKPLSQYLASEEEAARYYLEVLERLWAMGAAGAYAWCYGDYDPSLFSRPPLDTAIRERSFGLVRADGSEKPAAEAIRKFARGLGARPAAPERPTILDVTADEYYAAPERHFPRLYSQWIETRSP